MYDLVSLGEAMIRLSPPNYQRLEQAHTLDVHVGGAELSVAADTSRLGLKTAWVSKLPKNPLGRMIANKGREQGVDTSHVVWADGGRAGIYFLEFGSTPRASSVLYDRKGSAISTLAPGEVDWPKALKGAKLFHTSGITPALSPTCRAATEEALKAAKKAGCTVSFDLNYRSKLWSPDEAKRCLTTLFKHVDILITTQYDTEEVFGMTGSYEEIAEKLVKQFKFDAVGITLREVKTVLTGAWTSLVLSKGKLYHGEKHEIEIVDRVGAGDSWTAGFLYGYLTGGVEKGVAYADAMAALKHSIPGDIAWLTADEIEKLLKSKDFRVQR